MLGYNCEMQASFHNILTATAVLWTVSLRDSKNKEAPNHISALFLLYSLADFNIKCYNIFIFGW